jgi:cyclic-di-GMP phosphodiesterase TipF (flagellum assembly factor)
MMRISTVFVAICMVLIAASIGMILFAMSALSGVQAAIVAATVLVFLILFNAIARRGRDRNDVHRQIDDLSRGTGDLAKQVAEFGRRLTAIEGKITSVDSIGQERIHSVMGEIGELGSLMRQLAASVATHDDILSAAASSASITAGAPSPAPAAMAPQPVRQAPPIDVAPSRPVREEPIVVYEAAPAAAYTPAPGSVVQPVPVRADQMPARIKSALEANRIDLYLQPIVTLPQRKVRFYEAMTRLRDESDTPITPDEFIGPAQTAGLMGRIDQAVILRCMQVLRRLMVRNKDVGVFCNIASATIRDPNAFAPVLDFLEANRALSTSFVLEFKQATFRELGPVETEHLAALAQRGFRFSIDNVTDLRMEPRELADRGVRFIKVPARLLLDHRQAAASDIHAADLSDLLGRFGIDLIAERIEGERAVVDLLDFDVRFGQGFLFAAPRPLRPEAGSATAEPDAAPAAPDLDPITQGVHASKRPPISDVARDVLRDAPRTGNAALVRR